MDVRKFYGIANVISSRSYLKPKVKNIYSFDNFDEMDRFRGFLRIYGQI